MIILLRMFMLVSICFASHVYAAIEVSPALIDQLVEDGLQRNIEIYNTSDTNAYVKIVPFQVKNPGRKDQELVNLSEVRGANIIVTPNRLLIEAGMSVFAQIIFRDKPLKDRDRVFRVEVIPVSGGYERVLISPDDAGKLNMAVKVLVGYALPVMQRPEAPKAEIIYKRDGDKITLTNIGNTATSVSSFRACDIENVCEDLIKLYRVLYAGGEAVFEVPKNKVIEYSYSTAGRSKTIEVPVS